MGFLGKIVKFTLYLSILFLSVILIPNLPPHVSFTEIQAPPSQKLEGKLAINNLLNHPDLLFKDEIKGPESFVVLNGELYTSIHTGYIVKIFDDQVVPVVKFGLPCDGWWEEKLCGRPLGLAATPDGEIVAADAYYGIIKYNVNTGKTVQLVKPSDKVGDRNPKLFNGVDVAKDGSIYWTDSSSDFELQDGLFSFLADPRGRLIRYDPKTRKNEVLIDNLHFANGVAVSHDEDFVLVAETAMNTIHRYDLKGPNKGKRSIFVNDLPGLPDNLRRNHKGGFLVSLVLAKDPNTPVLAHTINPFPTIRKFLARTLALLERPFREINALYPNYYAARAAHFLGHFEMTKSLSPRRGTVVELDSKGNYVEAYHNTDGYMTAISDAILHNGYLYLGSPYTPYLARVSSSKLLTKLLGPPPVSTTTPKPTTTTPKPTTTTPKPTTTTPKPTTTTPKPTTTTPKPTTTTQKPTTTTQKPTTTTPKPAPTTPKPTTTTPKPTTSKTQKPAGKTEL